MKATGIIRRVDDLGRVAIPKEIRRNANIKEGDALEIFVDDFNGNPMIGFVKYCADENKMKNYFDEIINTLDTLGEYILSSEVIDLKLKISRKLSENPLTNE